MKRRKNNQSFQLALLCLCVFTAAISPLAYAANDGWAKRLATPKSWTVWPKESTSTLGQSGGEKDALELQIEKPTTIYQWLATEPDTLYRISFSYRGNFTNPQATANVRLGFRHRQRNTTKPIKDERFTLELGAGDPEWKLFSATIMTPSEESQTTQFALSFGEESGAFAFKDMRVEKEEPISVPHQANIQSSFTDPHSSTWKSTSSLNNFWNVEVKGELATADTDVKLSYDDEALYLLFINHEPRIQSLNKSQTERDSAIWNDDSNEVYIATPGGNAYQFIVGAAGGVWDGRLVQRVDGDPYNADKSWDGEWKSTVKIGEDRWWTAWRIPFSTLGETPESGALWRINFARHHYAGGVRESSRWSYANGKSNEIDRFGYLQFDGKKATARRFVEAIELHPLRIERPNAVYAEVLSDQERYYHTEDWSHDFALSRFPKSFQEKYDKESWRKEQKEKLRVRGEARSYGPFLPGAYNSAGWSMLEDVHKKYGMTFPYTTTTSGNDKNAIDNGAKYIDPRPHGVAEGRVVEFDPKKREALFINLDKFIERHPGKDDLIAYFYVVDEPTNSMRGAFSRIRRPDAKEILDEVDAEVRSKYGNSKFGLHDFYGDEVENSPYERIAFVKWWNVQMADWQHKVRIGLNERMPGKPILMSNHNTVGSVPLIDVPLLGIDTDMVSVDPYPTSVLSLHSRARALYHTGFTTKWMHDLSDSKDTTTIAQGFVYHSMTPSPEDVREWASQAIKNGAKTLSWYASGPAEITMPDAWAEIKKINHQVGRLNRLKAPTDTRTAIFHSINSQAGLNDTVLHSAYTIYSLLGERIGSWFEFAGDGQAAQSLDKYDLIYVPSASYLSKESAQDLLKQAQKGATIVLFDPLSLAESDLGEPLSARDELIGGKLGQKREAVQLSAKGGVITEFPQDVKLPLTPVANGIYRGDVLAYDIDVPKDAQVFATYEDGKPAAYSREVGKGRVLYFAAQPFGNSDLAIKDSPWEELMQALAKEVNEPVDLSIWNFYLKK